MSKFAAAVSLIAIGLGLGLWLGFNPEAHAAVEKNWASVRSSVTQIQSQVGAKISTDQPVAAATKGAGTGASQGASPLTAVPEALKAFWHATQQLWFNLLARVDLSP